MRMAGKAQHRQAQSELRSVRVPTGVLLGMLATYNDTISLLPLSCAVVSCPLFTAGRAVASGECPVAAPAACSLILELRNTAVARPAQTNGPRARTTVVPPTTTNLS